MNVYLLEDNPFKQDRFLVLLEELNKAGVGERFENGFGGAFRGSYLDAEMIWRATRDQNGLCLIDIKFEPPDEDKTALVTVYNDLAAICSARLSVSDGAKLVEYERQILEIAQFPESIYGPLPLRMLALCELSQTKYYHCSSQMTGVETYGLSRVGIEHVIIPMGRNIAQPGDVREAVEMIAAWFRAARGVSPERFCDQLIELGHDGCGGPDGIDLLTRYFRMSKHEFDSSFPDDASKTRRVISEALKSIGTVNDADPSHRVHGGQTSLSAAWLIAFGVFRHLFPQRNWRSQFDALQLCRGTSAADNWRYNNLHAKQVQLDARAATHARFIDFCMAVFPNKFDKKTPALSRVELSRDGLTFQLSFSPSQLRENLANIVRVARGEYPAETGGHDAATALWRLWLSLWFSDDPVEFEIGSSEPFIAVRSINNDASEVVFFGTR